MPLGIPVSVGVHQQPPESRVWRPPLAIRIVHQFALSCGAAQCPVVLRAQGEREIRKLSVLAVTYYPRPP